MAFASSGFNLLQAGRRAKLYWAGLMKLAYAKALEKGPDLLNADFLESLDATGTSTLIKLIGTNASGDVLVGDPAQTLTLRGTGTVWNPTGATAISPTGGLTIAPTTTLTIDPGGNTTFSPTANITMSPTGDVVIDPTGTVEISPTSTTAISGGGEVTINPSAALTLGGTVTTLGGSTSLALGTAAKPTTFAQPPTGVVSCALINVATAAIKAGTAVIVAGVTGFKIRIYAFELVFAGNAATATTIRLGDTSTSPVDVVTIPVAKAQSGDRVNRMGQINAAGVFADISTSGITIANLYTPLTSGKGLQIYDVTANTLTGTTGVTGMVLYDMIAG